MLKIGTITINKRRPAIKAKLYISLFILIILGTAAFLIYDRDVSSYKCGLPPTETFVKTDMEDIKENLDKKSWLEKLHGASVSTNWRVVEAQNTYEKYLQSKGINVQKSNGIVNVAGGKLIGQWQERGSNNQAGSVTRTAYDTYEKKLYVLSAGGSLWKGDISGLNWEIVSDQLRFDAHSLFVINRDNEPSVIITSINGIPHSFQNNTWTKANGFDEVSYLKTKDFVITKNGEEVFFLAQASSSSPVKLYHSGNFGNSFTRLRTFNTTQLQKLGLTGLQNKDELFIIEQSTGIRSKIYKWETNLNKINLVNSNSRINFGTFGDVNIMMGHQPNELFVYDTNDALFRSTDFGVSWQKLTDLPIKPWSSGLFISPSNPNKILLPNVEAYRSSNRGESWEKVNDWFEYYDNPSVKLHADIMHIAEYKEGNQNFIIVANHGGLSISYDNGQKFSNIGFNNLNIGQYYSAKTYPKDKRYLFGGSQDQGLQRTLMFEEGTGNFTQFVSGDYGHIQFTNNDKSLWSVFPGGFVVYYETPLTSTFASEHYILKSINEDVWLPPIVESPYHNNSVLLAGGSKDETNGSHIIELQISDLGMMQDIQWPFDFSVSGGTLSYIAINNVNTNHVYACTSNGKFYKSTNRGLSFTEKTNGLSDANNLYGSKILCSSLNQNVIFIGGSGYDNSPIFMSTNNGESFFSIQNNLPSTTVHDLVLNEDESFLFAATEAGPYVYVFKDSKWYELGQGVAPDQTYWSVEYTEEMQLLRFGTNGRGIWDLQINYLNDIKEVNDDIEVVVYPNPTTNYIQFDNIEKNIKSIKIIDNKGSILAAHSKSSGLQNKIDVSDYSNGIYYIIFESEKNSVIKNFIKI